MLIYSMQFFFQFCVSYIDENWTDIFIIPATFCGEMYARGRSGIIDDIGKLGDVTFIARNARTDAYVYSMQILPNFALAILTTI